MAGLRTAEQYRAQLQALLPPGPAWDPELVPEVRLILTGVSVEFARLEGRAADILNEMDPGSVAATAQVRAEQDKRLALEQQLAGQDQQHTKELSDAQRNQVRLHDQLATADVRLSVLLDAADPASGCDVPATPGAVGVVHAERRAQLDPAHAQRIVAITDAGDQGLIALRACQAYVRGVTASSR